MGLLTGRAYTVFLDCDWFTQAILSLGSAPPKGKQRRQLNLPVGEKGERRDENGKIVFGKPVAISVCLEWQIVILNFFILTYFHSLHRPRTGLSSVMRLREAGGGGTDVA